MTPKREVYVLVGKAMPEDSDYEQNYAALSPESGRRSIVSARRPSWAARLASWFGVEIGNDIEVDVDDEEPWILSGQQPEEPEEHPSRPAA